MSRTPGGRPSCRENNMIERLAKGRAVHGTCADRSLHQIHSQYGYALEHNRQPPEARGTRSMPSLKGLFGRLAYSQPETNHLD
eukprot:COSAG02_NODE_39_length_48074_cov_106.508890_7_plen_83_part_00